MEEIQRMLDIIDETVEFYSADPVNRRSIGDRNCLYNGPDGKRCAFSRYVKDEYVPQMAEYCSAGESYNRLKFDIKDEVMKPGYEGLDIHFWNQLQKIHDFSDNWNSTGLTDTGKEYVRQFKEHIAKDNRPEDFRFARPVWELA